MNTLRYIHANPKAASMQQGWFYDYSNYGTYDRLTQDGLTQWHPAFIALGATLEICAAIYQELCRRYKPKPKTKKRACGKKLLAGISLKSKKDKTSPGQQRSPCNDMIQLGSTNRGLLRPDRELLGSTVLPPAPSRFGGSSIVALIRANEPDFLSAGSIDGPCLAKIMSQVPLGESAAAATTVPKLLEAAQRAGLTKPRLPTLFWQ